MSNPKQYVQKSFAKKIDFQDGGSLIKLSFNALMLAEFARANQNEKGYLNLVVSKRRELGKYGDTH